MLSPVCTSCCSGLLHKLSRPDTPSSPPSSLSYACLVPSLPKKEILLVTWGLCFIATRDQTPTHKGRDFVQPLQKGIEIVVRKRRSSLHPTVCSDSEAYGEEERPHWEPLARARRSGAAPPGGGSTRSIPSVNGGSVDRGSSANDSSAGGITRQQVRAVHISWE